MFIRKKFIWLTLALLLGNTFCFSEVHKLENLSFHDKNLKTVFQALSAFEGINVFFDEQVRDNKVSIDINDMTFDQAIDLLLKTNRLFMIKPDPQTILIAPDTPEKQEQYQEMAIKTFYLVNAEAKDIMNLIRVMLATKQIFVNERLNALVIRDTPANMTLTERIIKDNDKLARQVDLELELFEVNRERLKNIGTELSKDTISLALDQASLSLDSLSRVDKDNLITTLPGVVYNIMKQNKEATILANPKVRITNRQKAKIIIADRIPLEISSSTFSPEGKETVTTQVQYKDIGIKFNVEPTIHLDDKVTIALEIEVSSIVGESKEGYPTIRTRNVDTFIRLNDQETKVLGGLISDTERTSIKKIPFLGDVPYLGALFSSKDQQKVQTEIMMAITPRIIQEAETETVTSSAPITESAGAAHATTAAPLVASALPAAATAPQPAEKITSFAAAATAAPETSPPAATGPGAKTASAASKTRLYLEPTQANLTSLGQRYVVEVRVDNVQELYGAPFHLHYNKDVVKVVDVVEGDFLKQEGFTTIFLDSSDSTRGRTFIGLTRQGKVKGASGGGVLARVTLESVNWGNSDLTISNDMLVDPNLNQISLQKIDGKISVTQP